MRETPHTLLRKRQQAILAGWPKLADLYEQERRDLEEQIRGDRYVDCPACEGEGVVERFYDTRLISCRTCDGSGVVLESEAIDG
jgi:DnaJ-class molecular chaperone